MVLFNNMNTVSIYTVVTVIVLITLGTLSNPFKVAGVFLRNLFISRPFLFTFGALVAILLCNKYELLIEKHMHYTADFTHFFYRIEGGFVAGFQHLFHASWLTPILAFFYLVVFQSLLIASIAIYAYKDKSNRLYLAVCYAIMLNYLIAIPFYLFFPIREVWNFDPNVHFYMLDVFPNFEEQYRGLSGLDNCFPSLHTSISVTLALVAARSGLRTWAWITGISAATIIFTIFYMGIHWFTDMIGGLVLATFASTMGFKLSQIHLASLQRVRPISLGQDK